MDDSFGIFPVCPILMHNSPLWFGMCVCVCVCLSVCLCICYHSRGGIVNLYTRTKLLKALSRYALHFQLVDFVKLVCRLQGSLVIYTRHYPEQLHCAYACIIDQEAFVWRMCTPCTSGLGEQHLCKVMYNKS